MMNWNLIDNYGLSLIMPEHLPGVKLAFSTRGGGVSRDSLSSLNLALHVGDDSSRVIENRRRFMQALQLRVGDMVCCRQVHGSSVLQITAEHRGRGALAMVDVVADADAMFTDQTGLALCTFYADCIPLLFYDPITHCIGMAHAGWKGTMAQIGAATLQAMLAACGLQAETVQVFIGPGIDTCCFAIGDDLAKRVEQNFPDHKGILRQHQGQTFWDLKLSNRLQLLDWGVAEENIHISQLCTSCCPDCFFSHRRDHGETGRMAALICLEEQ